MWAKRSATAGVAIAWAVRFRSYVTYTTCGKLISAARNVRAQTQGDPMSRFRIVIATLVAVAMMSLGAAACTPEQQAQKPEGIAGLVLSILAFNLWIAICQNPNAPCDA
jgi:hypothetical protein